MKSYIVDGIVAAFSQNFQFNMIDFSSKVQSLSASERTQYGMLLLGTRFFTTSYTALSDLTGNALLSYKELHYRDIKEALTVVSKACKSSNYYNLPDTFTCHSYYDFSTGSNELQNLRKPNELKIGSKLFVWGGLQNIGGDSTETTGWYAKGYFSCAHTGPTGVSGTITAYATNGVISGPFEHDVSSPPGNREFSASISAVGADARGFKRPPYATAYNWTDKLMRTSMFPVAIMLGAAVITNRRVDSVLGTSETVTTYPTRYQVFNITYFEGIAHVAHGTANPFYYIFSADGTLQTAKAFPAVDGYLQVPSYAASAVMGDGALVVGGYLGRTVHQHLTLTADTSPAKTFTSNLSYLGSDDLIYQRLSDLQKDPIWASNHSPTGPMITMGEAGGSIGFLTAKFVGELVLASGCERPDGTNVPFQASKASDLIYLFDSTTNTLSLAARLPKPLFGCSIVPISATTALIFGGTSQCFDALADWVGLQASSSVYQLTIQTDKTVRVEALTGTAYPHIFASTYRLDANRILIVSGEHYEVYSVGAGSVQSGTLQFGARYGGYIHRFVSDNFSQFALIGGWQYVDIPLVPEIPADGYLAAYMSRIEARQTYGGAIVDGATVRSGAADTQYAYRAFIPNVYADLGRLNVGLIDNSVDLNQAIYYQLDMLQQIMLDAYTVSCGHIYGTAIAGLASWDLYGSNDKQTWTAIDSHRDVTYSKVSTETRYAVTPGAAYRYYRFYLHKTVNSASIDSCEVYFTLSSSQLRSIMPVQYVGLDANTVVTDFEVIPPEVSEGWWRPDLDFETFLSTGVKSPNPNYRYIAPPITWNSTVEVLSSIPMLADPVTFNLSAAKVQKGTNLTATFDSRVATLKGSLRWFNPSTNSEQVKLITATTDTIDLSAVGDYNGNLTFSFYLFNEPTTYMKQISVAYVTLSGYLEGSTTSIVAGSSVTLTPYFVGGEAVLNPGNLTVTDGIPVTLTPTDPAGTTLSYTLTVSGQGFTYTSDPYELTITAPVVAAELPVFSIDGVVATQIEAADAWSSDRRPVLVAHINGGSITAKAVYGTAVSNVHLNSCTIGEEGITPTDLGAISSDTPIVLTPTNEYAYFLSWTRNGVAEQSGYILNQESELAFTLHFENHDPAKIRTRFDMPMVYEIVGVIDATVTIALDPASSIKADSLSLTVIKDSQAYYDGVSDTAVTTPITAPATIVVTPTEYAWTTIELNWIDADDNANSTSYYVNSLAAEDFNAPPPPRPRA